MQTLRASKPAITVHTHVRKHTDARAKLKSHRKNVLGRARARRAPTGLLQAQQKKKWTGRARARGGSSGPSCPVEEEEEEEEEEEKEEEEEEGGREWGESE